MSPQIIRQRASRCRGVLSLVCAGAMVHAAGCSLHLHNPADEALATKAADSFKAADISKIIENERAVLQASHERGLAATRRNIDAELDALLLTTLAEGQTVDVLLSEVTRRLSRLGFSDDPGFLRAVREIARHRRDAMVARDAYIVATLAQQSCQVPAFPPTDHDREAAMTLGGNAAAMFTLYEHFASEYARTFGILQGGDGIIGGLNKDIAKARALQSDVSSRLHEANSALEVAIRLQTGTTASTHATLDQAAAAIKAALAKYDTIKGDLQANADTLGMSNLLARVDLDRLSIISNQMQAFFVAWSAELQNGAVGENGDAARIGRTIGILVGASKAMQKSSTHARLVPVVAEQARVRIEIERLRRQLSRGERRIELLTAQLEQAVAEGNVLVAAYNSARPFQHMTVEAIFADQHTPAYFQFVLLLTESVGIYRRQFEETAVALISLDHDEALDSSEFALDLWSHTISTPLQELAAYHGSGIKPEHIAEFVKAAGLAGIAVGAN